MGAFDDWSWEELIGLFGGIAGGSGILGKLIYEFLRYWARLSDKKKAAREIAEDVILRLQDVQDPNKTGFIKKINKKKNKKLSKKSL